MDAEWQRIFYASPFRYNRQGSERVLHILKEKHHGAIIHAALYNPTDDAGLSDSQECFEIANSTQLFELTCFKSDSDLVTSTLQKTALEYATEQLENAEEDPAAPTDVTKLSAGLVDRSFCDFGDARDESNIFQESIDESETSTNISSQSTEANLWHSGLEYGIMCKVFTPELMDTIGRESHCKISLDFHRGCINIKPRNEQDLDSAKAKLGHIKDFIDFETPVKHIVIVRNKERPYRLRFSQVREADPDGLSRILLHPESSLAVNRGHGLAGAFECRYCELDPNSKEATLPLREIKPLMGDGTMQEIWQGLRFAATEEPSVTEHDAFAWLTSEVQNDEAVKAWVDGVQSADELGSSPSLGVENSLHTSLSTRNSASEFSVSATMPQQDRQDTNEWFTRSDSKQDDQEWNYVPASDSKYNRQTLRNGRSNRNPAKLIDVAESAPTSPRNNDSSTVGTGNSKLSTQTYDLNPNASYAQAARHTATPVQGQHGTSLSQTKKYRNQFRSEHISSRTDEQQLHSESDKDDGRVFIRTMRQRAPAPSKPKKFSARKDLPITKNLPLPEPPPKANRSIKSKKPSVTSDASIPHVQSRLMEGFRKSLDKARFFAGNIQFELQFGKILLSQIPKGLNRPFVAEQLQSLVGSLEDFRSMQDAFTTALSTRTSDFDALMKEFGLTAHESTQSNAYYEILCQAPSQKLIRVKLDALRLDKTAVVMTEDVVLGATYLHFPQRVSDARLILYGNTEVEPKSFSGVQDLIESLKISVCNVTRLPIIRGCDGRGPELKAIRLNSLIQTKVPQKPHLVLEVRRVHDFCVKRKTMDGTKGTFYAMSVEETTMIREQRLWIEMSLLSSMNPAEFENNASMPTGAIAQWNSEDVLEQVNIPDLESLAGQIVQKMDNVGYHNKGIIAVPPVALSTDMDDFTIPADEPW